jgi:DNA-binding Lrp family transcriptional regulator
VTMAEYERTRSLYVDQRMTLEEVGKVLGLRPSSVLERLERMGVPRRSRGGVSHRKNLHARAVERSTLDRYFNSP